MGVTAGSAGMGSAAGTGSVAGWDAVAGAASGDMITVSFVESFPIIFHATRATMPTTATAPKAGIMPQPVGAGSSCRGGKSDIEDRLVELGLMLGRGGVCE